MRWWEQHFRGAEGTAYRSLRQRQTRGDRLAVVVVDVVRSFVGPQGATLEEAIDEWPTACGPAAFEAIPHLRSVLEAARRQRGAVPVVFCRPAVETAMFHGPTVKGELADLVNARPGALDFPADVEPLDGELVLAKPKASAFFDTPLATYLRTSGVDSLLITGATTSGCVRATVVDAFSHGFATFVVEQAVFDRSRLSAAVSLYEMDAKYADVVTSEEAVAWLSGTAGAGRVARAAGMVTADETRDG